MKTSHLMLIKAKENKDSVAWEKLADVYPPLIASWLRQLGIQETEISDLTQEVLCTLVSSLSDFHHNGRTGAFRAWLRKITVNRCRRFWDEKKKRPQQLDSLNELTDPNSEATKTWDRMHNEFVVQRMLELIRPRFDETTFAAFMRSVIHGESAKDIAAAMGIKISQVYKYKFRVMQKLVSECRFFLENESDLAGLARRSSGPHFQTAPPYVKESQGVE